MCDPHLARELKFWCAGTVGFFEKSAMIPHFLFFILSFFEVFPAVFMCLGDKCHYNYVLIGQSAPCQICVQSQIASVLHYMYVTTYLPDMCIQYKRNEGRKAKENQL